MSLDVDDVMDEINGSQNILISSPISDTVSGLRNPITQYVIRQVLRKIGMSIYKPVRQRFVTSDTFMRYNFVSCLPQFIKLSLKHASKMKIHNIGAYLN